jgi:hypothetical protein
MPRLKMSAKFEVSSLLRYHHVDTLKVEAESSSKTSEIYQSTWCHIPEDWNLPSIVKTSYLTNAVLSPMSPCLQWLVLQQTDNFCFMWAFRAVLCVVCLHLEGQRRDAATVKRRKMAVYCVFVCI